MKNVKGIFQNEEKDFSLFFLELYKSKNKITFGENKFYLLAILIYIGIVNFKIDF